MVNYLPDRVDILVVLSFFLIGIPTAFAMPNVIGSGFGDANTNVCFFDTGTTCQGSDVYQDQAGDRFIVPSNGFYRIRDLNNDCPNTGAATIFYYGAGTTSPDTVGSWTVFSGASPAGSFAVGGSCGPGTPLATSTATLIVAAVASTTANLINGSWPFIIAICAVILSIGALILIIGAFRIGTRRAVKHR